MQKQVQDHKTSLASVVEQLKQQRKRKCSYRPPRPETRSIKDLSIAVLESQASLKQMRKPIKEQPKNARVDSQTPLRNKKPASFFMKEKSQLQTFYKLPQKMKTTENEDISLPNQQIFPEIGPVSHTQLVNEKELQNEPRRRVIVVKLYDKIQDTLYVKRDISMQQLKKKIHLKYLRQYNIDDFILLLSGREIKQYTLWAIKTERPTFTVKWLCLQEVQLSRLKNRNEKFQESRERTKSRQKLPHLQNLIRQSNTEVQSKASIDLKAVKKVDYQMSCGHKISEQKMKSLIEIVLSAMSNEVKCPKCDNAWSLKEVKLVGHFTDEEINEIGIKLSYNYLNQKRPTRPSSVYKSYSSASQKKRSYSLVKMQDKLPVLNEQKQPQNEQKIENPKEIKQDTTVVVQVLLISGQTVTLKVEKSSTVGQLKTDIFGLHYSDMLPEQTVISLNNEVIQENKKINQLELNEGSSLIQRIAQLHEIAGLVVDKEKIDPISCEKGMAKMSCGHQFSRSSVKGSIQAQLSSLKCQITCPHNNCAKNWIQKQWLFVGGYTQAQKDQIELKLSINWLQANTKTCPNCKTNITRFGLKTTRVRCPSCKKKDFCFVCLQLWNDAFPKCQSDVCKTLREQVANAPLIREFKLYDSKKKLTLTIKTPQVRACPQCKNLISNVQGCKHTKCQCNKYQFLFCFVCLQIKSKKGWPCGGSSDYCGFVAGNQTFQ